MNSGIEIINLVISIITLLIGVYATIFISSYFAPVVILRITPIWETKMNGIMTLRFEIENKSRIRLNQPNILVQLKEYSINKGKNKLKDIPRILSKTDLQVLWNDPIKLDIARIFPNETISLERIYSFESTKSSILFVLLQYRRKLNWVERIINKKSEDWQQTATAIIIK